MTKPSRDRVRFYLPHRYFNGTRSQSTNGMSRQTCIEVLKRAFGPPNGEGSSWGCTMTQYTEGFEIVCRLSQFARFIVYRNDAGECINGIKDLKPELFERESLYERLARQNGTTQDMVKRIALALGYAGSDESQISIDVSEPSKERRTGPADRRVSEARYAT